MPQRRTTRRFLRRFALAAAMTALIAVVLPAAASAGPTSIRPGDNVFCHVPPSERRPSFTVYASNGGGEATFVERGEILTVKDTDSNGWRTVALFSWCEGWIYGVGVMHPYLHRDSGPDEGPEDSEEHDFEFTEGRLVIMQVCEKKDGRLRNCSGSVYAGSA